MELRVLWPGPLDFTDSLQVWQGQRDVVQLALREKKSGADFFFASPHVAPLMLLLPLAHCSKKDETVEEEGALCCLKEPRCTHMVP